MEKVVTQIGPWPPPFGGVSVHVSRLSAALTLRGWDVPAVIAGRTAASESIGGARIGNSILRHFVDSRNGVRGIGHVHHRISLLTAMSVAGCRLGKHPIVLTLHGAMLRAVTQRPGVDVFMRYAIRKADAVIAVNEALAAEVALVRADPGVRVIPAYLPPSEGDLLSVDPEVSLWLNATEGQGPVLVLLIYRLLPPLFGSRDIYGLSLVTQAVESLPPNLKRFRLAVLFSESPRSGDEQRHAEAQIGRLASELRNRLGVFYGAYAPPLLARADLLLRPTLEDGDAVSVREAVALGLPVVASDAAPRPSGVTIHHAGDANALRECMEGFLTQPRASHSMRPIDPGQQGCAGEVEAVYTALSGWVG